MASRETIWHISFLGKVQAEKSTTVIERFQTQKTLLLLALLARNPGQKLRREELIDTLWPDADLDVGRNRLNQAVAWLRKNFQDSSIDDLQVLQSDRNSISINPETLVTDVQLFLRQINIEKMEQTSAGKISQIVAALDLYGGEFLTGYDERWIVDERQRLEDIRINALIKLSALHIDIKDYYTAIFYARKAVGIDQLLESSHEQLIRCLVAAGQPNAALRQYLTLEEMLKTNFSALPSPVVKSLIGDYLRQSVPTPAHSKRLSPALIMPITRFIGRAEELARAIASLTGGARLLTFVGIGGSGKTRLALESANQLQKYFKDQILFVPLADISWASDILSALAATLQLPRPEESPYISQVVDALSESKVLLVLDNAEHLLPNLSLVVRQLLNALPLLSILVTSRQELSLDGEFVLHISPLNTPTKDDSRTKAVESDSVKLFVDRVKNVRPTFELLDNNIETVAALCRGLEGIPLAIELCAAWAHTLNAAQMLEKLLCRFDLLVSNKSDIVPRHRSLRAAIEYSIRQLSPELQHFFAQVSVFRGGWTLDAIEWVHSALNGTSSLTTFVALAELRSRSLVEADDHGSEMRYRMLESLREFGIGELGVVNIEIVSQAHAEYFAHFARIADDKFQAPSQNEWAARLDQERQNIATALEWCFKSNRPDIGLAIAIHLTNYWKMRGQLQEASYWLKAFLNEALNDLEPSLLAAALNSSGFIEWSMGNFGRASIPHAKALEIRQDLGDSAGISESLYHLGITAYRQDQLETASEFLQSSLKISEADNNQKGVARALLNLGNLALAHENQAEARKYYERSLAIEQQRGDIRRVADSLSNIGITYGSQSDFKRAKHYSEQCVAIRRELKDDYGLASDLICLARAVFCQKDYTAFLALITEGLQTAFNTHNKYILAQFFVTISQYYFNRQEHATALYFLCCYSKFRIDMEMKVESHTASEFTEINEALLKILGEQQFVVVQSHLATLSLRKLNDECMDILNNSGKLPAQLRSQLEHTAVFNVSCTHCHSSTFVRFGKTRSGHQRLRCKKCGHVVSENPDTRPFPERRKQEILFAYRQHVLSQREIARQFHVSRNTLAGWIKQESITIAKA